MKASAQRPVAKIQEPGWFTTIQDSGRWGYRRFGVPVSGALDIRSLFQANALLGNSPGSPALEIFSDPITVTALADMVVSHAGNDVIAVVDGSTVSHNPIRVMAGSTLLLEPTGSSLITYVAFAGGLWVKHIMGSASTYTRGGFGGLHGRRLEKGDLLYVEESAEGPPAKIGVAKLEIPVLHRAVKGPHADLFPPESVQSFFSTKFLVSSTIDRMGYRLEGPALKGYRGSGSVLTLPVFPGMVQVPPDGHPIVLMADCQTTGGYPIIAMVLAPDLGTIAQKPPGTAVAFREVTDEESLGILRSFATDLGVARTWGSDAH